MEMTILAALLRCVQLGLLFVNGICLIGDWHGQRYVRREQNDDYKYREVATQED